MGETAVEIRLLGEVALVVHGRPVDLGPARQRCVWAALAVDAGRVVPVERLVERVWGGHPPLRVRATVLNYVSRLRQVLADAGADAVGPTRRSGGYLLQVDRSRVDLHRFRDLCARARAATGVDERVAAWTRALALWRGEPLTGLTGHWAEAERDRLRQEHLAARHDLVDARLLAGGGEELVTELATRVAEHPLDERVAAQHLLALHRAGRSAEALEHYRRLRTRLAEELGTDPGTRLQDLHRRILSADPALTTPPATTPPATPPPATTPPPAAPVPRQLPAAPRHFTGRAPELAALTAALDQAPGGRTVVISAIAGTGGIGKTWLALHWAHTHAHRFPDGQLFVDLRGFSPDGAPMDPAVAVRGFLDVLGVDTARLPVDPHARTALFRTLVADRRMLVVLDNAADTDQVTPLLPGSGSCAVLVTSRNRLPGLVTGYGAHHLPLDVLTGAEARALLAERLGAARTAAEPAAVDELVALCGGFPLALAIVAAHAHTRPRLKLTALAAELRDLGLAALDDADPTASLPAVLSWSHDTLTPDQARAFALLGIAPGPDIGLPAAACLTGLPLHTTRTVLRGLEQASLITSDHRGRHRMHDLVRAYAADTAARHLPEPEREAALRRVADCYTHTAHTAERLLYPQREPVPLGPPEPGPHVHHLPDDPAAMAWFDDEHHNLLAVQHTAAALRWHRTAWQLAWCLVTHHHRRGHLHDRITVWRTALHAAAHLDDPATRITAHRLLGVAHSNLGRHEEAVDHLDRALALAEHHRDRTQQAHTHRMLALAWERRGDDRRALDHVSRALPLHRALHQPVLEADALNSLGWYAARLGDHDTAREHCLAALALQRRHHDTGAEANTLDSLGYIDHRTGRHAAAVDHYRQALALYRDLGHAYESANTLDRLGHPHAALGQRDRARAAWCEALEMYRQQGRDDDAERVRRQLAALDRAEPLDHTDPAPPDAERP